MFNVAFNLKHHTKNLIFSMDHPPIQIKFLFLNYEVIMRSQFKKRHSAFLGCCRTEDR
jgi:hypothetical protein